LRADVPRAIFEMTNRLLSRMGANQLLSLPMIVSRRSRAKHVRSERGGGGVATSPGSCSTYVAAWPPYSDRSRRRNNLPRCQLRDADEISTDQLSLGISGHKIQSCQQSRLRPYCPLNISRAIEGNGCRLRGREGGHSAAAFHNVSPRLGRASRAADIAKLSAPKDQRRKEEVATHSQAIIHA
jgi:hypothetical protein